MSSCTSLSASSVHVFNNAADLADTPITVAVMRRSTGIYETAAVMRIDSRNSMRPYATEAAMSSTKDRRFSQWQVHIPQQALNRLRLS